MRSALAAAAVLLVEPIAHDATLLRDFARSAASLTLEGLAVGHYPCQPVIAFGAWLGTQLVGCGLIGENLQKPYCDGKRKLRVPVPNLYFFGAYVLPQYRGFGVGTHLCATRLEFAQQYFARRPIVIEILGTGAPGSVHADARPGLHFYLCHGFIRHGYSVDADAGAVIARGLPVAAARTKEP